MGEIRTVKGREREMITPAASAERAVGTRKRLKLLAKSMPGQPNQAGIFQTSLGAGRVIRNDRIAALAVLSEKLGNVVANASGAFDALHVQVSNAEQDDPYRICRRSGSRNTLLRTRGGRASHEGVQREVSRCRKS